MILLWAVFTVTCFAGSNHSIFVLVLFTLWNLMTLVYNFGTSHVQENTSVLYLFSFEPTCEEFNTFFLS